MSSRKDIVLDEDEVLITIDDLRMMAPYLKLSSISRKLGMAGPFLAGRIKKQPHRKDQELSITMSMAIRDIFMEVGLKFVGTTRSRFLVRDGLVEDREKFIY